MSAFKPGDLVQLGSGSPSMTVREVGEDGQISVDWFDGEKIRSHTFAPDQLIAPEPPEPGLLDAPPPVEVAEELGLPSTVALSSPGPAAAISVDDLEPTRDDVFPTALDDATQRTVQTMEDASLMFESGTASHDPVEPVTPVAPIEGITSVGR